MTSKELIDEIEKQINGNAGGFANALAEALPKMHPSLQQSFWFVIRTAAEGYSETVTYTDGRNEQAVKLAKEIAEVAKRDGLCFWVM